MKQMALHWQILLSMVVGAALGIALNATTGNRQTSQPVEYPAGVVQLVGMADAVEVDAGRVWSVDSPQRILIQVDRRVADQVYRSRRVVVGDLRQIEQHRRDQDEPWPPLPPQLASAPGDVPRLVVPTLHLLQEKDPQAFALFQQHARSTARTVGDLAKALGDLFLRMLKMVSVPLIITSLLSGILGLGQAERLGKMFGRTLLYYLSTSLLAIAIGLLMVNLIQPGVSHAPPPGEEAVQLEPANPPAIEKAGEASGAGPRQGKRLAVVLFEQLQNMIPPNPFEAIATGQFLSIIAFTLALGVCTILVGGSSAERIGELVDASFHVMMKLTMLIIRLAPVGVFFLMLSATATQGAGIFGTLGWYMLTVACALAIHAMIVLPAILHFVARRNPRQFAQAMSPALLTAFSSASSNGTLPLTLTCVEERARISNRVGSFVLPLGATINMDGTALYEVVAVLFIAQLSGIELSLAQQVVVALTALLASIGAAGIPHAGLVMMVIILQAVGLPTESQGLIIAVDRVLDMGRTAVNVWSDSCGCAVVSRLGAFDEKPAT